MAPKAQAQQKAADAFVRVVEEWKSAWDGADPRKLAALYAPDLLQSPASRASQERLAAYLNRPGVTLQDLSIYSWKDAKGEIRVVNLRTGLVLAAEGGLLGRLRTPFRLGLGGRLGNGAEQTVFKPV